MIEDAEVTALADGVVQVSLLLKPPEELTGRTAIQAKALETLMPGLVDRIDTARERGRTACGG